MFLAFIVVGLVGMLLMALPAFSRHGGLGHGHALGHGAHLPPALPAHSSLSAIAEHSQVPAETGPSTALRLVPSPRALFTLAALYGAFGNALVHAAHLSTLVAALVAILPAILVERALIRPLWNAAFRHQTPPSSAFEALVLCEARALTSFKNGKGLIETTRDGRRIQLSARLRADQRDLRIDVGTTLEIEDVDAANERVTVALRPTT